MGRGAEAERSLKTGGANAASEPTACWPASRRRTARSRCDRQGEFSRREPARRAWARVVALRRGARRWASACRARRLRAPPPICLRLGRSVAFGCLPAAICLRLSPLCSGSTSFRSPESAAPPGYQGSATLSPLRSCSAGPTGQFQTEVLRGTMIPKPPRQTDRAPAGVQETRALTTETGRPVPTAPFQEPDVFVLIRCGRCSSLPGTQA